MDVSPPRANREGGGTLKDAAITRAMTRASTQTRASSQSAAPSGSKEHGKAPELPDKVVADFTKDKCDEKRFYELIRLFFGHKDKKNVPFELSSLLTLHWRDTTTLALSLYRAKALPPLGSEGAEHKVLPLLRNLRLWLLQLNAFCEAKRNVILAMVIANPDWKSKPLANVLLKIFSDDEQQYYIDQAVLMKMFRVDSRDCIRSTRMLLINTIPTVCGPWKDLDMFDLGKSPPSKVRSYEGLLLFCGMQAFAEGIRETSQERCASRLNEYLARTFGSKVPNLPSPNAPLFQSQIDHNEPGYDLKLQKVTGPLSDPAREIHRVQQFVSRLWNVNASRPPPAIYHVLGVAPILIDEIEEASENKASQEEKGMDEEKK